MVIDFHGYQRALGGVLLGAWASHGTARRIELDLVHGRNRVSSVRLSRLTTSHRRVVLRGHRGRRLPTGRYELVVKLAGRVRARHSVHAG